MGEDPAFRQCAGELGHEMARRGTGLVYGGGSVGLMGVVADAALQNGGCAFGVIPELLLNREVGHAGLTELIVVPDMHTRKAKMMQMSQAFIVLPGGFGTFEEMFEIVTWNQLGYQDKPICLLNVHGYYDSLIAMIQTMTNQDFVTPEQAGGIRVANSPSQALDMVGA